MGSGITNPYGRSKFFIEEIIKDLCKAEKVLFNTHINGSSIIITFKRHKVFLVSVITSVTFNTKVFLFFFSQSLNAVMLRYFNPVGAHKSGRIGEDPQVSTNY